MALTDKEIKSLEEKANDIRESIIRMLLEARSGHTAGPFSVKVLNLSTIKPLDKDAVVSMAREAQAIVTVEEHQIAGGMGSAVAECLARNHPVRVAFIGVDDKFGQSGKPDE